MSVISVQEIWPGRDSDSEFSKSRTHKRVFRVLTDSHSDDGTVAGSAAGLPVPYEQHPGDPGARATKQTVTQDTASPRKWIVTVEYSTGTQEQEEDDNPLNEPVKRSWSVQKISRLLTKNTSGKAVLNAAGDPFDPPAELPRSLTMVKFVRNEASFGGSTIRQYIDKINSRPFGGAAVECIRCDSITADENFKNGVSYFTVTYEFLEDPLGWQPKLLEAGFRAYKEDDDHELTGPFKVLGEDGKEVDKPVPLDERGVQIPNDQLPDAAVFLEVDGYYTVDFNALGLPA